MECGVWGRGRKERPGTPESSQSSFWQGVRRFTSRWLGAANGGVASGIDAAPTSWHMPDDACLGLFSRPRLL